MMNLTKQTKRAIALVCLSTLATNIFVPTLSLALTNGPIQVEYTSYESADARDAVSLISGDFQHVIPLLEVPGPEGNFKVPLFYHADIKNEDEASWVGLGWNINVGSIARNVIGFPDDYYAYDGLVNTKPVHTEAYNPGGTGWVDNYIYYQKSWDSEKGYSGALNLFGIVSSTWGDGSKDVAILGIHSNSDKSKNHVNMLEMAQGAMSLYSLLASPKEFFINEARNQAIGMLQQDAAYQGTSGQSMTGFNIKTNIHIETEKEGKKRTTYKYWYQNSMNEMPYGSLYLGYQGDWQSRTRSPWPEVIPYFITSNLTVNFPDNTSITAYEERARMSENNSAKALYPGQAHYTAGDAFVPTKNGQTDFFDAINPIHIAYDAYSVMAPGISGSIKPYRLDMGSLLCPKKSTTDYLSTMINGFYQNKLRFKYTTDYSNYYTHHIDGTNATGTGFQTYYPSGDYTNTAVMNVSDPYFRYSEESPRTGLNNSVLQNGRNVEWFTSEYLRNESAIGGKVMLYHTAQHPVIRDQKSEMGAITVTDMQGTTYHFVLSNSNVGNYFDGTSSNGSYLRVQDANRFATSYLLTGITGSDFVDKNNNNRIDNGDYGYWVKFNYGQPANYQWRFPYSGFETSTNPDGSVNSSFQYGNQSRSYLNSIETRTHIALFAKSDRKDGLDANATVKMMQLDQILLFKKTDLVGQNISGFGGCIANPNNGCDCDYKINPLLKSNITPILENLALKRILFVYDNSLCKNTPNSTDVNQGKLTLKSISFYKKSVKLMPDYSFNYEKETDGAINSYATPQDQFGYPLVSAWNLNKITAPTGVVTEIHYEKDDFASVSGVPISTVIGGGSRVAQVLTKAGTETFKKRYIYYDNATSTGVISKLSSRSPSYNQFNTTYPVHSHYDYPNTGVLYSKVTELSGRLTNDSDFEEKKVYEYTTPNFAMVSENMNDYSERSTESALVRSEIKQANFHITDNTASIGTIKAISTYSKDNLQMNSTRWDYTSTITSSSPSSSIGKFTEAAFLFEQDATTKMGSPSSPSTQISKRRLIKTSKMRNPLVLSQITLEDKGVKKIVKHEDWDFFTALPVKITQINPQLNKSITTIQVPAYKQYPSMGLKAVDPLNKNMLSQTAYSYSYLNNDPTKIISANVQTWNNVWSYRELLNGNYTDVPATVPKEMIYRKQAQYFWYSSLLNPDGSYTSFTPYNFTGTNGTSWQKAGETTRYNHFSQPLEDKDINGNFVSKKYGYFDAYPLSSSTLSNYNSSFHTSFEDLNGGWFGGEVKLGTGALLVASDAANGPTVSPHTGYNFIKAPANTTSVVGATFYGTTTVAPNTGVEAGRTYRVSVWVHPASDPNATLFWYTGNAAYNVEKKLSDASAIVTSIPNGWSLLRFDVTLPSNYVSTAANQIQVGVKGGSTKASYFDDLRVHPVESAIGANTYDNEGRVEYTLNQDNYFTRYVYNVKGQVAEVYQETPNKGIKKVKEYTYHLQSE